MKMKKERRKSPRGVLPRPEVAIVYPQYDEDKLESAPKDRRDTLLVDVLNWSEGGLLFESHVPFKVGSLLSMRIRLPHKKVWIPFEAKVVRVGKSPDRRNYYRFGVELHRESEPQNLLMNRVTGKKAICPSDSEFLMRTRLFGAASDEVKHPLLNCMTSKNLQAGKRFIREIDEGYALYVTKEGSCAAKAEKDSTEDANDRPRADDMLRDIALLSAVPHSTHVDAETYVRLWAGKTQFDALRENCPDFQNFLTDLLSHRSSKTSVAADRTVGKYVVNETIAEGGWSIVYKGTHKTLNMSVAIKMLKHDMAVDPDFSEKFRYEAKTIARLKHENIVKIYDIEELYRTIFIVMEYLEGSSLDRILEKTPKLPLSRALAILLQVCGALAYAHKQGIVHQDVKPGNIFIQRNDRVKIVDFGLACPRGASDSNLPGTVYYMAPEQIEGKSADERTDIYCLGITAFEMITGQRPFPEDEVSKLMDLHLNEDVPDARALVPDLPDELHTFIMRATQRHPAARHGSVLQALRDLEPLAEKMGLSAFLKTVY